MSAADEAVVRRFYEQMNNERKNELAPELFTESHVMHDPQVPAGKGPQGMADVVKTYQDGVDGHWGIEDIFSTDDNDEIRHPASSTPSTTGSTDSCTGTRCQTSPWARRL